MYCRNCGLSSEVAPIRRKTQPELVAEMIVVAVAAAVIVWLALDARAIKAPGFRPEKGRQFRLELEDALTGEMNHQSRY
jgi:hypothetical protein